MKMESDQHQKFVEICREELEAANARIAERTLEVASKRGGNREDKMESIRRLYEDLADKEWTEPDEKCLQTLGESSQLEIKKMIRDAFRHSPVIPVPSFRYLVNLAKKMEREPPRPPVPTNPDAFSSVERERLANLLAEQLHDAAEAIIKRVEIDDAKCSLVHDILQDAQGNIVSHFSPLV
jgi:hypothetical protein